MKRLCLDCQRPYQGRTDKKFCSDICRSNFNNGITAIEHRFLHHVNAILKKNRRILRDYLLDGQTEISRERLLTKGFDFGFYTHATPPYLFCYEFGYQTFENHKVLLIKNRPAPATDGFKTDNPQQILFSTRQKID